MIREYRPEDYEEIAGWHRARGADAPSPALLSSTGHIVPGVAAGWLYLTNSGAALLEHYVSNPNAEPGARNAALDEITLALFKVAIDAGCRVVIALTADDSIADRARKHGLRDFGTRRVLFMEV